MAKLVIPLTDPQVKKLFEGCEVGKSKDVTLTPTEKTDTSLTVDVVLVDDYDDEDEEDTAVEEEEAAPAKVSKEAIKAGMKV